MNLAAPLRRAAVIALAIWLGAANAVQAQATASRSKPPPASASIWFHPMPAPADWSDSPSTGGSTDFLELFQPDGLWPIAAAHVSVFGMYAGWIAAASDQDLQQAVEFLNAHGMGIEIEAPSLQATSTCGSGVEGYVPFGLSIHDFTLAYLRRLKALGAQVTFVKVDEPFFFGNVVGDPRSCHFPVSEVARQVGKYSRLVKTVYPKAAVGDVEPVIAGAYPTDVVSALQGWHRIYRNVVGKRLPFFIADNDYSNPEWPEIDKQLETATRNSGMRFGIIYIGDELDTSDAEWSGKAVARFESYQLENGGKPDYVLFQSWQPHPTLCLPEIDSTTFTGVLDAYISATE